MRRYYDLMSLRVQEINRQPKAQLSVQSSIEAVKASLDKQFDAIQALINAHIETHSKQRQARDLLLSIPGVGMSLVVRFLAEAGDISRFDNIWQIAAFIRPNQRLKESGWSGYGRAKLPKMDNDSLRKALYMPALSYIRYNLVLKALSARLVTAGKPAVGAVMWKLVHLMYGVLKSGQPFDHTLEMA